MSTGKITHVSIAGKKFEVKGTPSDRIETKRVPIIRDEEDMSCLGLPPGRACLHTNGGNMELKIIVNRRDGPRDTYAAGEAFELFVGDEVSTEGFPREYVINGGGRWVESTDNQTGKLI